MVLTRKKYKDQGILPNSPQSPMERRRRQSKITSYFPQKDSSKRTQNESILEVAMPLPLTVLDWSTQLKDLQTNNKRTNHPTNLAQELAIAENATKANTANTPDANPHLSPLEPGSNLSTHWLKANDSGTEMRGDYLQEQIYQISTDLLNVKNFLSITNGLLLTLVDNFKQHVSASVQNTNPLASPDLPLPSKPRRKKAEPKMKKSKNMKNLRRLKTTHRTCKKYWQKLFNLLPSLSTNGTNKSNSSAIKETRKVDTLTKESKPSFEEPTPSWDKGTNPSTVIPPQSPLMASTESVDRGELATQAIEGNHSSQARQMLCPKREWSLVLIPQKLVFANYPKPPRFYAGSDRIDHFLSIISGILPGVVKAIDIAAIEYLHQDDCSVRALITFLDHSLASFIFRAKNLFKKERIVLLRIFENRAPLTSLMGPKGIGMEVHKREKTNHQNHQNRKHKFQQDHLHQTVPNEKKEAPHPTGVWPLTCDSEDSVLEEELSLIKRFWSLHSPAQTEILKRLDLLRSRLEKKDDQGETMKDPYVQPISPKCLVDRRTVGGTFKCVDVELQSEPPVMYNKVRPNQGVKSQSAWHTYLKLSPNELASPPTPKSSPKSPRREDHYTLSKQSSSKRANGCVFLDTKELLDVVVT